MMSSLVILLPVLIFKFYPYKSYSLVRIGLKPEFNALCSVMFAITLFIVVVLPTRIT